LHELALLFQGKSKEMPFLPNKRTMGYNLDLGPEHVS